MRFPSDEMRKFAPGLFISVVLVATTAVLIILSLDGNEAPDASIEGIPEEVSAGEPVLLDGSSSSDPDGDEVEFLWEIKGGNYSEENGICYFEDSFFFSFPEPGTYTVILRVTDPSGKFDTETVILDVV